MANLSYNLLVFNP